MNSKDIFITSMGTLFRRHKNLYFKPIDGKKKHIPIEAVQNIFILNRVNMTYSSIKLLLDKEICVHIFYENEKRGIFYYLGSILPRQRRPSGFLHIKQVEHYLDKEKRIKIAIEIVDAIRYNCIKVIERYPSLMEETKKLRSINVKKEFEEKLEPWKNPIEVVLGIESLIWNIFYDALDKILKIYKIGKRTKRPPKNEANTIISFCNSLLYCVVLSEIYKTHLDPTVSFLHEPFSSRFSLALDLAEPFKPILTFRTLIWVVNQGMIKPSHFKKHLEGIYLNEYGKKIIIKEFIKKLEETIKLKNKPKKSIRFYIRKQCYDLEAHLSGTRKFEAFKLKY